MDPFFLQIKNDVKGHYIIAFELVFICLKLTKLQLYLEKLGLLKTGI